MRIAKVIDSAHFLAPLTPRHRYRAYSTVL
jgi:hypothetical protein